jgi:hypothetical protein
LHEAKTQMPDTRPGMTGTIKRTSRSCGFSTRIVLHAQGIFSLDSEPGESWGLGRRLWLYQVDANAAVEYFLELKRLFLREFFVRPCAGTSGTRRR